MIPNPLVSFAVLAYNQEAFVRQAVAGALAQTYEPLEIILSDDCSTDHTFAIMQEMVAAYGGPHRIVLNRNARNLGLVRHINQVFATCRGELVVGAAGDDISVPERTATLVAEWNRIGQVPAVLYSQVQPMARDGTPVRIPHPVVAQQETRAHRLLREWGGQVTGASCATTMSVWRTFGPLDPSLPGEDLPLTWRSALCGRFHYLPQTLVYWRIGAGGIWSSTKNATPQGRVRTMLRWVSERHLYSLQACLDVAAFPGAGWRERLAARRFRIESRCLEWGLPRGLWGLGLACLLAFLLAGWPSRFVLRTIRLRLRYWCEEKRANTSAGWRGFFRCYYFLRRHGMPGG